MGDLTESVTPVALLAPSVQPRSMPVREDCWSEEATSTLIDAWGRRHIELNRGNLRQKDWQEVADAVNALHGHSKKTHRSDVQCKNRIDTIKKKYKTEKARVSSSNGTLTSSWIFYDRMDALIGSSSSSAKKAASPSPSTSVSPHSPPMALPLPMSYKKTPSSSPAMAAVVLPQKRLADKMDDGYFRRNYSAAAAAAVAADAPLEDDEEDDDDIDEDEDEGEGMRRLAKAIERFGEAYERVEAEKLRQMVDLEKQRMQFAKDLEVQRLKMFMDTQVQLQRMKHSKRSGSDENLRLRRWWGTSSPTDSEKGSLYLMRYPSGESKLKDVRVSANNSRPPTTTRRALQFELNLLISQDVILPTCGIWMWCGVPWSPLQPPDRECELAETTSILMAQAERNGTHKLRCELCQDDDESWLLCHYISPKFAGRGIPIGLSRVAIRADCAVGQNS